MTTKTSGRPPRRPRPVHRFVVEQTEWLTPHLVRVVIGGPGFDTFTDNGFTDHYVKIKFGEVTRTYTIRKVDEAARQLVVDFVVHGDEGLAGPWAAAAKPGDPVELMGPGGAWSPDSTADFHLLAGDAAALPAIASGLEELPSEARGRAYLVVEDQAEQIDLSAPPGVEIRWLFHAPPGSDPGLLAEAIASDRWPDGRVAVFAHGERESMKAIRALMKERGVPREDLSLSGYWAYGRNEDRFQAEKREPIGKID